jgi:sugar phosphate isomerase/epimerase
MANNGTVKRCVSLYSFQEEFYLRKMTLEEILETTEKLDIPGVEIIGDQMIRKYPNVPESFYEQWQGWMKQYHRIPVCLDMFLDWNKFKGRRMTEEEKVESVTRDIQAANRLGCTVIRVIHDVSPSVMEKLASTAEKYNVKLALEIHAPSHFESEHEQRLMEMFERVRSHYLGFTVDCGIFTKRLPRVITDRWVRDGMKEAVANYVIEVYNSHSGTDQLEDDLNALGATPEEIITAQRGLRNIFVDPRKMLDYMQWIYHIHGKFNEMLPDYTEYGIPYEEIVPVLKEGGYDGYISSEYEGNRWIQDAFEVDSTEQVRRHQIMLKRLIDEV